MDNRAKNADLYHLSSRGVSRHQKLALRIAVNGASKDMRGQCPASNLSLIDGDFGDDAGMFVDNEDTSFVGKSCADLQGTGNSMKPSFGRRGRWQSSAGSQSS
jgi:hypothetical protein